MSSDSTRSPRKKSPSGGPPCSTLFLRRCSCIKEDPMSTRNKFLIMLSVIFAIALAYYFFSTPSAKDLVLIGTVDANQVVVSPQIQGRIQKLLVDEGTPVKQGDLIALLDPSELEAQERAAAATIASLRSKVSESQYTQQSTKGSTSSDVANAQARLQSARAQLA